MTLHRIPTRFLNTTLHIVRDVATLDDIGDTETVKTLAYGSILANVQPFGGGRNNIQIAYEVHGKVYQQSHVAYFNRFIDEVKRKIYPGDYAIDIETDMHYLILAVLDYQSSRQSISDSHHIKLIMTTADGRFDIEQNKTLTSKASIA